MKLSLINQVGRVSGAPCLFEHNMMTDVIFSMVTVLNPRNCCEVFIYSGSPDKSVSALV